MTVSLTDGETAAFFVCLFVFVILIIWYLCAKMYVVPQDKVIIVESFGRYSRLLAPGRHLLGLFESPRTVTSSRVAEQAYALATVSYDDVYIDLREKTLDVSPRKFLTRDTVEVSVDLLLYYRITDPLSYYKIQNVPISLEQLCVSTLRNVISTLLLDETFTSRNEINTQLRRQLDADCSRYGIVINRVCIESVMVEKDIVQAMESQRIQEWARSAQIISASDTYETSIIRSKATCTTQILKADAERHNTVTTAKSQAQAKIIQAQGLADSVNILRETLQKMNSKVRATSYMYAVQYLEAMPKMLKGSAIKLVDMKHIQKLLDLKPLQ